MKSLIKQLLEKLQKKNNNCNNKLMDLKFSFSWTLAKRTNVQSELARSS